MGVHGDIQEDLFRGQLGREVARRLDVHWSLEASNLEKRSRYLRKVVESQATASRAAAGAVEGKAAEAAGEADVVPPAVVPDPPADSVTDSGARAGAAVETGGEAPGPPPPPAIPARRGLTVS